MKKRFSLFLAVVMILSVVFFAIPASAEDTFNASDANPTITTAADLKAFLEAGDSFSGKTVTLQNDITLNADTTSDGWYNAGGVVVINLASANRAWFNGIFDGQGYTIKGLVVKSNGGWHTGCGMFAGVNGNGVVENFTLDGFYVCSPNTSTDPSYGSAGIGAVIGHAKTTATIDNVTLKNGTVTCVANGKGGIGSIVGCYDGQNANQVLAITNCAVEDTVTVVAGAGSSAYVGGLIGYVHENYTSHPTTIDLTGSTIKPAGSDFTLAPFGAFLAGGNTGFSWTIKNDDASFSQVIEMYPDGSGADPQYLATWNNAVINSRSYGPNAYANTFNASDANPTITTASDYIAFFNAYIGGNNFSGKTVTLAQDIVLNDTSAANWYSQLGAQVFTDNGESIPWFSGTFDGANHTIYGAIVEGSFYSNIYATEDNPWRNGTENTKSEGVCGLFPMVDDGATIQNLTVDGFYICGTNTTVNFALDKLGVGGLIGVAKDNTTISGVTMRNGIVTCVDSGINALGAVVGQWRSVIDSESVGTTNTLAFSNCLVEDTVGVIAPASPGEVYCGGLIGHIHSYNSWNNRITITSSTISPAGAGLSIGPIGRFIFRGASGGYTWTVCGTSKGLSGGTNEHTGWANGAINGSGAYSAAGDNTFSTANYGSDSVFTITTAIDMKAFLESDQDFSGKTVNLVNDITFNADTTSNGWYNAGGVVQVAPTATYFKGTFNGNGHTIKGLVVKANVSWAQEAGMFPGAMDATIQNFTLDGFYVCNTGTEGNEGMVGYGQCSAGAVVGHAKTNVTIDGVTVKNGTVTCVDNGYAGIGSIAGCYDGQVANQVLAITNCVVEPSVTLVAGAGATAYVGGLIGYVHENYKSHPTTIDLTGSRITPAGSDSSLEAFGLFWAGGSAGDNQFLWTLKNDTTGYTASEELTGSTYYTTEFNAYARASGAYGPSKVSFVGVQEKDTGNAIRFVGLMEIPAELTDVTYLGFEVTVGAQTADLEKTQCTKVYTSILEAGTPVAAPTGFYYFTFVITGIDAETTFEVRALATINGTQYYTSVGNYTYTPA